MIKKRILSLWISLCVICIAGAQEKELAYCNRQIHKTLKAIGTSSKLPRAIEAIVEYGESPRLDKRIFSGSPVV